MKTAHVGFMAMVVALGTAGAPALAADAPTEDQIAVCAACHGVDGRSSAPIYPNLAGQSAAYMEMALKAYRAGEREGGMSAVMTPQAANLSDQEITDLSAYYSKQ